ncbi:hypothetical protein NKG94_23975 [Micromonospora sp. M12]
MLRKTTSIPLIAARRERTRPASTRPPRTRQPPSRPGTRARLRQDRRARRG